MGQTRGKEVECRDGLEVCEQRSYNASRPRNHPVGESQATQLADEAGAANLICCARQGLKGGRGGLNTVSWGPGEGNEAGEGSRRSSISAWKESTSVVSGRPEVIAAPHGDCSCS